MDKIFRAHKETTIKDFKLLWEKALFVFDTNVLLDLYRLPDSAKKDLLNILSDKKINNRVWLPFQVALEFNNNRIEAISDQKNKFNLVSTILSESLNEINKVYGNLHSNLNKLQLKKRHSVINPDTYVNETLFKESVDKLTKFQKELSLLDKKHPDVNDKDELKNKISKIFESKVGTSFTKEELELIYKEGESRYKDNIPPGYKDSDKKGFYSFEDKKFTRKYGDLLAWKEIIKKAKDEKLEYIILITGDVKEDWWQEVRGKKLGPRLELLNEIYFEAPELKMFYIYDTSSFMHNAKNKLKISIKQQSITETKDLLEYTKSKSEFNILKFDHLNVKERIEHLKAALGVNVFYGVEMENEPRLFITKEMLDTVLLEVLLNVKEHALDNTVEVGFSQNSETLDVYFINAMPKEFSTEIKNRAKGIELINKVLGKHGTASYSIDDELFEILIRFNKIISTSNKY
jgi:hypothetical protein